MVEAFQNIAELLKYVLLELIGLGGTKFRVVHKVGV